MAYFAEIDGSGLVLRVISISNDDAPDPAITNSEPVGQSFIANVLNLPGIWKQCSYNSNFRKQYPGPGFRYDYERDAFISPQPYPSWVLDENSDWVPPIPAPTDTEHPLYWDEESLSWKLVPESEFPPKYFLGKGEDGN